MRPSPVSLTLSRPFPATTTLCPHFRSQRTASFWLTSLSSANKMRSGQLFADDTSAVANRSTRRHGLLAERGHDHVEQIRLFNRLGCVTGHATFPGTLGMIRMSRRRQHHQCR